MKKSLNSSVIKSTAEESLQLWSPAAVREEKQTELPEFLLQNNSGGNNAARVNQASVIKSGEIETTPLNSWIPGDILQMENWMNPVSTQQPGQSGNINWITGNQRGESHPRGSLNSDSERMEELIRQAQEQAERQVLKEQEHRLKSVKTEAEHLLNTAETVLEEIQQLRDELISNSEESILNLVLDISRALFADGVSLEKEVLEKVVLDALKEAKDLGNLTLHLHPEDQKILDPHWPETLLGGSTELRILPDPQVERGGCFLDGEYGQVDARLSTKIQEICSALQDVHTNHESQNQFEAAGKPE